MAPPKVQNRTTCQTVRSPTQPQVIIRACRTTSAPFSVKASRKSPSVKASRSDIYVKAETHSPNVEAKISSSHVSASTSLGIIKRAKAFIKRALGWITGSN